MYGINFLGMKTSNYCRLSVFALLILTSSLYAQNKGYKDLYIGISQIESAGNSSSENAFMFGLGIGGPISNSLSGGITLNWRKWNDRRYRILFVHPGLSFYVKLGNKFYVEPSFGLGPGLSIGNDYGAVFASWSADLKFHVKTTGKSSLFLFVKFNQNMLFHSSGPQEVVELGMGFRL